MTRTIKIILGLIGMLIIVFCLFIGGCMGDRPKPDNPSKSNLEISSKDRQNLNSPIESTELDIEEYGGISTNLENQIEVFATQALDTNRIKHSAEDLSRSEVGHISIFNFNGLKNYYAYSDKRYPKRTLPNHYEHFTVFVFEYENEISASNSFKSVYANSNLNSEQLDRLRKDNPKLPRNINTSLKPGGLICQKNNYVLSLVKTCRKPPVKKNWNDYEELFIRSISTGREAINTLNAHCGMMKYKFDKRKPTDNNR